MDARSNGNDVLNEAQGQIARLIVENKRLRKEAIELRKRYAPGRNHKTVARARDAAIQIMHYRYAGVDVGRRWLRDCGLMTERQHGWAFAMLRYCRLEDDVPSSPADLDRKIRLIQNRAEELINIGSLEGLRSRGNMRIRQKR